MILWRTIQHFSPQPIRVNWWCSRYSKAAWWRRLWMILLHCRYDCKYHDDIHYRNVTIKTIRTVQESQHWVSSCCSWKKYINKRRMKHFGMWSAFSFSISFPVCLFAFLLALTGLIVCRLFWGFSFWRRVPAESPLVIFDRKSPSTRMVHNQREQRTSVLGRIHGINRKQRRALVVVGCWLMLSPLRERGSRSSLNSEISLWIVFIAIGGRDPPRQEEIIQCWIEKLRLTQHHNNFDLRKRE